MTPFDQFVHSLSLSSFDSIFWVFIKVLFIIAFALYLAFAAVVVRQVKIMGEVVEGLFIWPLKVFAWAHLLVSIFLFLLSLIVL